MKTSVGELVDYVRSKNAGPFWITIDIFCGSDASYDALCQKLTTERVAETLRQPLQAITRFDISSLNVIKFSLPRPVVQGHRTDRDMHGAQWAVLIEELRL
jgi:hypothetical protein